jgi:hypothetical protein
MPINVNKPTENVQALKILVRHPGAPLNERLGQSHGLCILRLVMFFDPLRDRPLERRALPFSGIFRA